MDIPEYTNTLTFLSAIESGDSVKPVSNLLSDLDSHLTNKYLPNLSRLCEMSESTNQDPLRNSEQPEDDDEPDEWYENLLEQSRTTSLTLG